MAVPFHFDCTRAFTPAEAEAILRSIPARPGVFALFAPHPEGLYSEGSRPEAQAAAEPYLTRTADLRRRIRRLLNPPESQSKRLNLRDKVARIEYTVTGSDFASSLVLYHAAAALFGYPEARRRLKLHTPYFLRFTAENLFPRVYITNRLAKRALAHTYGPFPSRAAAERYCDAVLDLFKLRRCCEELAPTPNHPGCVYQEMKKCLAPCNQAVTPEAIAVYTTEAAAVANFLATHGEGLLTQIAADRDRASANMDFEAAAALHAQHQRAKTAAALAAALVQPIPDLRAVIVQAATPQPSTEAPGIEASGSEAPTGQTQSQPTSEGIAANRQSLPGEAANHPAAHPDEAALFLLAAGCLTGPEPLSTLGVRAVKEQTSVGSSLFAQPLMLQAVPLGAEGEAVPARPPAASDPTLNPEARAAAVLSRLEGRHSSHHSSPPADIALLSDHLSLLRRWYYRPEKQRVGEIFFPNPGSGSEALWPIRRILRGAARMALGDPAPMAETQRTAAKAAKTKPTAPS